MAVRFAVQGSAARPGRHSHTVPEASAIPVSVVDEVETVLADVGTVLHDATSTAAVRIPSTDFIRCAPRNAFRHIPSLPARCRPVRPHTWRTIEWSFRRAPVGALG